MRRVAADFSGTQPGDSSACGNTSPLVESVLLVRSYWFRPRPRPQLIDANRPLTSLYMCFRSLEPETSQDYASKNTDPRAATVSREYIDESTK